MLDLGILIVSVIGNLALGVATYRANMNSRTNQLFTFLVVITIFWLMVNFASVEYRSGPYGILLVRFVLFFAAAQIATLFLFVHTFPRQIIHLKDTFLLPVLIYTGLVMVAAVSPYMFTHIENNEPVPGPAIALFALLAAGLLGSTIYQLIHKIRHSRGVLRRQLRPLAWGIILTFGLIALTNFIFVVFLKITSFLAFTPAFTLILLSSTAYAIAAHHLFDIRVIIRRTVVFSTLLGFVFFSYTGLVFLFTKVLNLQTSDVVSNAFLNLILILVIGYSFQPIREWISDRTDRWLFKKEYEQEVVLRELGQRLNNVIALDEALEGVMQTVTKVLHIDHAITYVFQPGENNSFAIKRVKQMGYSNSARLILEDKDFTVQYFSQHPAICHLSDFKEAIAEEEQIIRKKKVEAAFIREHAIKQAVLKKMEGLEVSLVIPLQLNNQPLGLICLSEKLSGEDYSQQDLALLELVGAQAISSIQKAKLYEGDQMKSEFVSIASHELLTPISAIEGYLSMILEENLGKVDPQARDYLNKVFTSAKRLSLLIKDLLSVSRIESGKMKIEPQQLDIEKMITDTIDQLKFVAADKKLTVVYNKPEKPLPPVWADPDRTMQVMVNLVSNAIKYTPKGDIIVTAELHKAEGKVSVAVKDTGIGMDKEQMSHLFTKFYRVDSQQTSGIAGTGLGLYITKSIIEKMGGAISVASTPGQGSTFSFTLPIFKVERSEVKEMPKEGEKAEKVANSPVSSYN